ncbi:ABC transporter substrate-binding protein [Sphaerisporangium krabiense]|uniref:NitT/TauT family transport system substrate-binding protein n=1 Tax=Sphaerisporangium krabiense TaxID=763782 RepID=A0A7W9DTP0_9ACTN|nr:ABC transporter substrate-binding protein [Sphaerisporangium krabiense]MBB5631042.1 NitT/TauT family transport system substrate-binding protein [Sphaerisporangium krabiense]
MRRVRGAAVAAAVIALAGVTACGSDSGGPGGADGKTLTVSVVPSAEAAMLYVARDQGFFKAEGLTVQPSLSANGPANVASVVSNSSQFGHGADTVVLLGRAKNLPLVAVAAAAGTTADPKLNNSQTLVMPKSGITRYRDLTGKAVGVVAVKNQLELFIRRLVDEDGGDSGKVRFLQLPFADMPDALTSGRVDAVTELEPFVTELESKGAVSIGSYYGMVLGDQMPYNYWFTNENYAKQNPAVVAAFTRALEKAGRYSVDHPEAVRKALTEYTGLPAAQVEKVRLPDYNVKLDAGVLEKVADMLDKYRFGAGKDSVKGAVFTPAP